MSLVETFYPPPPDYKSTTKNPHYKLPMKSVNLSQEITYLNVYGCGIGDLTTISTLRSLTVCLLANNHVTDLAPVLQCRNLVKLDVSTNKVRGHFLSVRNCISEL